MRLIIVDDETRTRDGLVRHLEWDKLGITLIQVASSGEEALTLCEEFQPDIILSDIRMRGMSGIEMCTKLHKLFPDASIIFISGYSDKEYLKAAIELGAVYYVEKPTNMEELEKAVVKAIDAVKRNRKYKSSETMQLENDLSVKRMVFFSLLEKQDRNEKMAYGSLFPSEGQWMRICIFRLSLPAINLNSFSEAFEETLKTYIASMDVILYRDFADNQRLVVLLYGTIDSIDDHSAAIQSFSSMVKRKVDGIDLFLTAGNIVHDKSELYKSFEEAKNNEKNLFYLGFRKVILSPENLKPTHIESKFYVTFSDAIAQGDLETVKKVIASLEKLIQCNHMILDDRLRGLYFSMDHEISRQYYQLFEKENADKEKSKDIQQYSDFKRLESIQTMKEMHQYFLERFESLLMDSGKEECNSHVVSHVIRSINQNYQNRELSVKRLAGEVYLTPTYLSSLFKRKTGKTIGEYLTTTRMNQAKVLLSKKQLKLYHISEMVGYDDPNYFAKSFKKHVGLTPSEFRDGGY